MFARDLPAQAFEQGFGGLDADVGGEQDGFQLLVQRLVDPAAGAEQAGELAAQLLARLGQSGLEALRPARARRGLVGCRGLICGGGDLRKPNTKILVR